MIGAEVIEGTVKVEGMVTVMVPPDPMSGPPLTSEEVLSP